MTQGVSSPSMSGNSARMDMGGQTVYSDVLWNNHLIGDFSSQGLPDSAHSIVPNVHNFTYDVYFYATNISASQALEFDINQFFNGQSFIWGHECRIAGGNEWDIWDNPGQKWHSDRDSLQSCEQLVEPPGHSGTENFCQPPSVPIDYVERADGDPELLRDCQLLPLGMASRSTTSRMATTSSSPIRFGWTS